MKTDRLIAITMYLLNREVVSAAALSKRFEVSKRTIQRDIDTLNQAGIPIVSAYGINGGYEIMDGFKLAKQLADAGDYLNIITALKGLGTAFEKPDLHETLEKTLTFMETGNQHIFMDLSAAREGSHINEHLTRIDEAVTRKALLSITYSDSGQNESTRIIEPLALSYQWYSWYVFAYCHTRQDYRYFKLSRIQSCERISGTFEKQHGNIEKLMKEKLSADTRTYHHIRLQCRNEVRNQALEYFPSAKREELPGGDIILTMDLPYERMWFSLLLGFGNKITVLEPEELKIQLTEKAKEILALYQ